MIPKIIITALKQTGIASLVGYIIYQNFTGYTPIKREIQEPTGFLTPLKWAYIQYIKLSFLAIPLAYFSSIKAYNNYYQVEAYKREKKVFVAAFKDNPYEGLKAGGGAPMKKFIGLEKKYSAAAVGQFDRFNEKRKSRERMIAFSGIIGIATSLLFENNYRYMAFAFIVCNFLILQWKIKI